MEKQNVIPHNDGSKSASADTKLVPAFTTLKDYETPASFNFNKNNNLSSKDANGNRK